MTDKPIDWTAEIVIEATDWQGELPARLIGRHGDVYRVAIEAPHKTVSADSPLWGQGEAWSFYGDGKKIGSRFNIRVINKRTDAMIEAGAA